MNFPTFIVNWVDPNDTTRGMEFFPPKGSDELHEALKQYYPHLTNLQARMRQASIDFLLEQDHATPASEKPTPSYLPSPSSLPSSVVASPSDAMQSAAQNSTKLPKQEDLMNVWTLPSNPDAKIHKRRTMTAEEKRAYKQKRLEGACADCKRRRRKCQHGTSPAAVASSSCKPARRNPRPKPSLEVSTSPSAHFPANSIDQCLLPEQQPIHDVAFNLFSDLPTTLGPADGNPALSEMDVDPTLLGTEFLDLTKDWDLFPDTHYNVDPFLQPAHAFDIRQYCAASANTPEPSSFYSDIPFTLDHPVPSLGYQARVQPADHVYPAMSLSLDQLLNNQPSSSSAGTVSAEVPGDFHGPGSLMDTSPSSSSQDSFSDTGHVPGGSYVSPSTSVSSDLATDWGDFYPTVDGNAESGPLPKKDVNRHVSRLRSSPPQRRSLLVSNRDGLRPAQLNDAIAGSPSQHQARHQKIEQRNALAASPLTDSQPVGGHVIGISRSKKPEQIDSRQYSWTQFHGPGSMSAEAGCLRDQNLVDAWHRRSAINNILPASQMSLSTTSNTRGDNPMSHVQQPDRNKDRTILSLTRDGAFLTSSPTSTSTRAPSRHHSVTDTVYAPRPTAVFSAREVGGADYSLLKPGHHSLLGQNKPLVGVGSKERSTELKTLRAKCGDNLQPSTSSDRSARWAQQYHFVNHETVLVPGCAPVPSLQAVERASHPLPVVRHECDSPDTSVGWRVPRNPAEHRAQICLGVVYFCALLRANAQGKKISGMSLDAVLAAALLLLSLYGFVLR